jgi:hypothetical protein
MRTNPIVLLLLVVACSNGANGKRPAPGERDGGTPLTARSLSVEEARTLLWRSNKDVELAPSRDDEKAALASLIGALWRGADPDAPPPELAGWARSAGLVLEVWTVEGRRSWVLREPDDRRRGAGVYLIRAEPPPAGSLLLLQAPHADYDVGTGAIASRLFFEGDAAVRGVFGSSLHRYQHEAPKDVNPADVAHNEGHAFQAATRAALGPGVTIVQLHGFAPDTVARDAIVSAGVRDASTALSTRVADGIRAALAVDVARYPEDTRELGATRNVQGRLAREVGAGFVHVEMSAQLRDRLRDDPDAVAALGRALVGALP